MSTRTSETKEPTTEDSVAPPVAIDAVLAAAVDVARAAAQEIAGTDQIGAHLDAVADGDRVVTHSFVSLTPGYRGWRWAVTLARAPRVRVATVSEVVMLPGPDSVIAPTWVPWSERLAPGDLGPNDQLAYRPDDPMLEPGYTATDDEDSDYIALWELGLGRARVLSPSGRAELAERWYTSDRGPTSDEAIHAEAACSTCGFFLPLAGRMRQVFGVCGNSWSPSDGRVVSVDHGCGAHSETDVEHPESEALPPLILDETGYEAVVVTRSTAHDGAPVVAVDDGGETDADGTPEPA